MRQASIAAGGDFVIVHGRFFWLWRASELDRRRYRSSPSWAAHRALDVIQDEATQEQSKSGLPMFGDKFPQ